jgi:hypothetical protein
MRRRKSGPVVGADGGCDSASDVASWIPAFAGMTRGIRGFIPQGRPEAGANSQ